MNTQPNDDGGPAFPVTGICYSTGMSLRDWFAGQALAATNAEDQNYDPKRIAQTCYSYADAMIAARKGQQ